MRFSNSDRERLSHVKNLILSDLSRHIPVRDLARVAGMNERKLHEGFKRIYKQTLFLFLKEERMKLAMKLLKESSMQLTEIANLSGYAHPENFTHAFKNHTGMTPLVFRKSGE